MFMVGGGILSHGIPVAHHYITALGEAVSVGALGGVWGALLPTVLNALLGVVVGAAVLLLVSGVQRLRR